MPAQLLATKFHIPRFHAGLVSRPRLVERLTARLATGPGEGYRSRLTLISAPAGFGKTTLVSEWVATMRTGDAGEGHPAPLIGWLSLDESDNEAPRFLAYAANALMTAGAKIGSETMSGLQSPGAALSENTLTSLINDIAALTQRIVLVLDDYHVIASDAINDALDFLIANMPAQMHLVIATRSDPDLPLSRLRGRGQLTELRARDLCFSLEETDAFLRQTMRLDLSAKEIASLETRTEGWIAGLQLAAVALQGRADTHEFIQSFTGSHRFVLDYLIEEVLERQPAPIQSFLIRTAILDQLTGSLCDALTGRDDGQQTLEALERQNLFLIPLDDQRQWYRYHHLFRDLLRQRLNAQGEATLEADNPSAAELHIRASEWYEAHELEIEAFRHAGAAHDVDRATRLIEGKGMPLIFRGALAPVLGWLGSLPPETLDARPLLWITFASARLATGQRDGVEEKLQAAERALRNAPMDDEARDLLGRIAATRATLAISLQRVDIVVAQSRFALEHLAPNNLPWRTSTTWKLGGAYALQGDRAAAIDTLTEAVAICEASGIAFIHLMACIDLGDVLRSDNQLHRAARVYRRGLERVADPPPAAACGLHIGLATVLFEWNNLDAAERHTDLAIRLARPITSNSALATCLLKKAHIRLARGDADGAASALTETEAFLHEHPFLERVLAHKIAAGQVRLLLQQGDSAGAAQIADKHQLPVNGARVHLAMRDAAAAMALLVPYLQQAREKGLNDQQLQALVVLALAHWANGETDRALSALGEALAMAESEGFIRIFLGAGPEMAALLAQAVARGISLRFGQQLLATFAPSERAERPSPPAHQARFPQTLLVEPLSARELEVLHLVAEGLSNPEIASRLYLSLNTVKVHTRNIYGKLDVHSRTRAAARARELGLLPPD